jgi:hypothetical protein
MQLFSQYILAFNYSDTQNGQAHHWGNPQNNAASALQRF